MSLISLCSLNPVSALTTLVAVGGLVLGGVHAERAEVCGDARALAWALMEARQLGVPMEDVLQLTDDPEKRLIVVAVYAVSRGETAADQDVLVRDFANGVFDQCLEGR